MLIKIELMHGITGAKPPRSSAKPDRMTTAEIANEFIGPKESMGTGAEGSRRFASKGNWLMTSGQSCWDSSVMRDGSEANP